MEKEIGWQLKQGNTYFWLYNWLGLGALYKIISPDLGIERIAILVKDEYKKKDGMKKDFKKFYEQIFQIRLFKVYKASIK